MVRVTPGAREDAVIGWQGDVLRIRVRAPAEQGKANHAACRVIAKKLGLRASSVSVVRGATFRDKVLEIQGIEAKELLRRLGFHPR